MAYAARKQEGTENWEVINVETEEVKATHEPPDAEENAKLQVERLNELEKEL